MDGHLRRVLAAGLLVLAALGGGLSLERLVETASWFPSALVVLSVTAASLVLIRTWLASIWLPTVISGAIGIYLTAALFVPGAGMLEPLPGVAAPGEFLALLRQGMADTATQAPVVGSAGLALGIVSALLVVLLLAELLAVGCRAPAWSGIALLAPWMPAVALGEPVPTAVFVLAATGYLGLLVLHSAGTGAGQRARHGAWRSAAGAAALTVVVALIAAPAVLLIPTSTWQWSESGGTSATRLDLGLDVSDHLDRGADDLLYSYRASDPENLGPLHAYTLTEFTGQRWLRGTEPRETEPVQNQVLWPGPIEADRPDQRLQMNVLDLAQDRLLLPDQPRRLSIEGEWAYDGDSDEVIGSGSTPLEYEAEIFEVDLDPADLNAVELIQDPEVDPLTLHVPDTGHADQIRALTQRVVDTAGARTQYEQAVAIQDFLRFDSQFTYDVEVDPARTSDAVWDFLGSGRGYCVQFATAMVVMARTLDIPARMAVGFLPGEESDQDGTVEVSGHRAHTWPQVYFDGVGWVRFEPTPPERTGAPPEWATGVPEGADSPEEEFPTGTAAPQTPEEPADAATAQTTPESTGAASDQPSLWRWLALAIPVGLIGSVLAWQYRQRRGSDVERSWARVRRAATGIAPESAHPGETPRGLRARVGLTGQPGQALSELVGAVERHRYAPPGRQAPSGKQVHQWRRQVLEEIRRQHPRSKWRRKVMHEVDTQDRT
ncbi:transglutaminaseTgpA domain-containing protein [Pseudactinotalea sp. Z1748]|uniref:transglutaminase family protein n=1 Tax=Pseudactinotalea sp. Z1748 TaxID=3413027 RepID=UPI003C7B263F